MFRCKGVSSVYDTTTESIGVVPWTDVNATSISFWCHDPGENAAAQESTQSGEDDDDDAAPKRSQVMLSSSSPSPDPVLVQIPYSGMTDVSFSRTLSNCVIRVKRSAFMESDLTKIVRFGKEHEFLYETLIDKEDFSDFRHALQSASGIKSGKSHSPQKPAKSPSKTKTTKSPSKTSPAPPQDTAMREYSTRDLHTNLSFVTPSKKRKSTDDSVKKSSAAAPSVTSTIHPTRQLPSFLGRVYGKELGNDHQKRQRLQLSSRNGRDTREERLEEPSGGELSEALLATLPNDNADDNANDNANDNTDENGDDHAPPSNSALPTPSTAPEPTTSDESELVSLANVLALKRTFKESAVPGFVEQSGKDLRGQVDKLRAAMSTFETSLDDAERVATALDKAAEGVLMVAREIGDEALVHSAIGETFNGVAEVREQITRVASAYSAHIASIEVKAVLQLLQKPQQRDGD